MRYFTLTVGSVEQISSDNWRSTVYQAVSTFNMSYSMCSVLSYSVGSPVDYGPPGSSVLGIFQARMLEWVAISYSRGFSWPRNWTQVSCVSCIGRWILYHCTTWKTPSYLIYFFKSMPFSALNKCIWNGTVIVLPYVERDSLVIQLAKNSPTMQETLVHFLGQEDSLQKG